MSLLSGPSTPIACGWATNAAAAARGGCGIALVDDWDQLDPDRQGSRLVRFGDGHFGGTVAGYRANIVVRHLEADQARVALVRHVVHDLSSRRRGVAHLKPTGCGDRAGRGVDPPAH